MRAAREATGDKLMTFARQCGPPTYLHTEPSTRRAVVDQSHVCDWGQAHIRDLWSDLCYLTYPLTSAP